MDNYYIYIMSTWDNKVLYVGVTNDLQRRVREHKGKLIEGFTKRYNIKKLVYFETFSSINDAIKREKEIKGWTRAKKNVLVESINSKWLDLSGEYYL